MLVLPCALVLLTGGCDSGPSFDELVTGWTPQIYELGEPTGRRSSPFIGESVARQASLTQEQAATLKEALEEHVGSGADDADGFKPTHGVDGAGFGLLISFDDGTGRMYADINDRQKGDLEFTTVSVDPALRSTIDGLLDEISPRLPTLDDLSAE